MKQLFQDAKKVIPGGVNSPVRSFGGVGGEPIFIDRAAGAFLYDVGGKAYIDYVGSWGPMILGHAHPQVIEAVKTAADKGLSFGTVTEIETKLAAKVCDLIPSIDMVRMVSSGTEATMSALRLARAYSRRDKIVKFAGNYHGHSDSLLAQAGSGVLTCGIPSSPGVPKSTAADTITLPYNDSEAANQLFAEMGDSIAAVIVEPIAGNMNCIPATTDFLHTLRSCCSEHASVLIFDEVMSGFRVGLDGAQGIYGIQPDLTTLGKIIGGGMPVGAFGGSAKIMQHLAPIGEVYQAGTLSGNPVAMAAGLATLQLLEEANFYESLASKTSQLVATLQLAAAQTGIPFASTSVGGMFGLFFAASKPQNLADAKDCNQQHFRQFFHAMLEQGVYLAPSAFEAGFVSAAHDDDTLAQTSAAASNAFKSLSA